MTSKNSEKDLSPRKTPSEEAEEPRFECSTTTNDTSDNDDRKSISEYVEVVLKEVGLIQPPEQTGTTLGAFKRNDNEELRASWSEYEGHPFLNLRVWSRDHQGQWWPVKGKGLNIKVRELRFLAEMLSKAAKLVE